MYLSARAETKGRVHITPQASWLRNADHYQLTYGSVAGENFNRSDVYTAALGAWTEWAAGRTAEAGRAAASRARHSRRPGPPASAATRSRTCEALQA